MIEVAIIVGSTRPNRNARAVADWVYSLVSQRDDAEFVIVDIVDFNFSPV
jgi:NAD(P)H-dependent FMN reductase